MWYYNNSVYPPKQMRKYNKRLKQIKPLCKEVLKKYGLRVDFTEKRINGHMYKKYYSLGCTESKRLFTYISKRLPEGYMVEWHDRTDKMPWARYSVYIKSI